jgi:sulfite reductase alpha subunit-like flavoprotein
MKLLILYGSQTGTASEIASIVGRQGRNRHLQVSLSSMDDYDRGELVNEALVVFIASTTGQGSEPDNMKVKDLDLLI